jgi:uncharacterized protein (DUF305 family)
MGRSRRSSFIISALAIGTVALAAACSSRKAAVTDTTAAAVATPPTTASMSSPGDSAAMNGAVGSSTAKMDANHEFLRKMSDHHRGLIQIVHQTVDRKDVAGVLATARKLDTEQDAELDTMTIMLRQKFNDPYDPQVMPEHQAMADSLKVLSGAAYDRAFRQDVIRQHQEALSMINEYLPRITEPKIKSMAEGMRVVQTKEIDEMQYQLSHP